MTSVILQPSPLRLKVEQHSALPGQTIAEILAAIPSLPPEVWTRGVVRVGEWEIPADRWHRVRPRVGNHLIHVGVRLGGGGSESGGKNALALIASIALVVAATAITGGAAAGLFGTTLFAAGSTSAALLAAGVSIVGALALNALSPAPTESTGTTQDEAKAAELGSASFQGNILAAFEPVPFVIGTHRVSPPHLTVPWSENINDDQYVNAIVGLNGAHLVEDIRINGTPIEDFADVEFEVRDVVTDDTPVTLIDKQVFESQVNSEISGHKIQDDQTALLQTPDDPEASYPVWVAARSRSTPDEIWLTFLWTTLILQEDTGTVSGGIPVRLRIRRVGDTAWTNLPEFHAQRERLEAFRGMIKLRFAPRPENFTRLDQGASVPPWKFALYHEAATNDESFDVDPYFEPFSTNNAGNVTSEEGVAVIYLDPDTFPKGTYDVQVMRGYSYKAQDFTPSIYKLATETPYFFSHTPATDPPSLRQEQAKAPAKITLAALSSVWLEPPLGEAGFTLIAVRAKNIAVSALTALVTGYAYTHDTGGWATFEPTSNPASWWRFLALGGQSIRAPYIQSQLDDDALVDWHDYCNGEPSFECNAYVDGNQSLSEILRIIAGCGRASVRLSDKVGVVIDRDRTSEGPIQLFTQRNTSGLSARRAFGRIPDALRVKFNDESNDYAAEEIFVNRKIDAQNVEAVTYTGVTSRAQAVNRANLDIGQMTRRSTLYSFQTDIESIRCTRGSLVALAHDTLKRHYGAARVDTVQTSSGDVTGLTLDSQLLLTKAAAIDTFEDATLASPPEGWASQWDANVTALVTAQASLPEGQGPLVDKTTATGDAFFAWNSSDSDGEVLALIRPDTDSGTTDNAIGVILRGTGNNVSKTGYRAALNSASAGSRDRIEISKWVNGTFTFLANATFAWATGTNYWIRFRARGTSLRAKVWEEGDPEPSSWMVTATDSDVTGPGRVGAYIFHPSSSFYLGSFSVTPLNGVVIQLKDGTTATHEINETIDTRVVTFVTPFPDPGTVLEEDCLVASGPFDSVQKRMLVLNVQPQDDMTASLTLVDEAPPVGLFSADGEALYFGADRAYAPF
jgi:predicted phage tail protein